jgi:MFS family permease
MRTCKFTSSTYAWIVVGLLWVVAFLNYFDRILITSMRDPIVASFTINDAQFGLLTSVFLWSYGILSPLGGYFADKYGRKPVIIFSVAVWSVVTLWTGFAQTFGEMLIARVCMGISEACYIPAALALIADYHKGATRSLATGIHMSGLYAGLALGGLGGYISEMWGWRFGFQVFGFFGVAYALVLVFGLKKRLQTQTDVNTTEETKVLPVNIRQSLKLFSIFSFRILLFYFCAYGIVNWLIYGWLPTFLKSHFNLDLGQAGISATGYVQIGSFAGVLLGGILADRWHKINKRGRLYIIIIGFTVGAPFLFLMSSTYTFGVAIAGMIIYGVARGFNDANLMPVLCQVIDERYIATGYGFLNFLSTIIGGIMVFVGGILRDANISLSVIYGGSAILLLLAAWSLFLIKIKNDSERPY